MGDGLLTRHTPLNAGSISANAEELAQKYQKLFEDWSCLKAKHAVLIKAVKDEKGRNDSLKENTRGKENTLRELQRKLDNMTFHNARLEKRIEALQDTDTKDVHFSILGGSIKKELEKCTENLEATKMDLEYKIKENEELHKELEEVSHIYTNGTKGLCDEIAKLKQRIPELEEENADLEKQLKQTLTEKNSVNNVNKDNISSDDDHKESEIRSLRAILLAKAGNIESRLDTNTNTTQTIPPLPLVIPACEALDLLETQARDYIGALHGQPTLKRLPHEIAAKLKVSSDTWSEETQKLAEQLKLSEDKIKELLNDNERLEKLSADDSRTEVELNKQIDELRQYQLREEEGRGIIKDLQNTNLDLTRKELIEKQRAEELQSVITDLQAKLSKLEDANQELRKLVESQNEQLAQYQKELEVAQQFQREGVDNGAQVDSTEKEEIEEDDDEFVYTGKDAQPTTTPVHVPDANNENITNDFERQLEQLTESYESKIEQLTIKLQKSDSIAERYAELVKAKEERLQEGIDKNTQLQQDMERTQQKLTNLKELLETTERNYQTQINAMTEQLVGQTPVS